MRASLALPLVALALAGCATPIPAKDDFGASALLAIGDVPRVGQTVRLHVRDAESASHELDEMLARANTEPASAALLFSCNGRGRNLFAQPDHDAGAVGRALGTDAVVGCFCQGELGPVGDRTFVHAFTASLALW